MKGADRVRRGTVPENIETVGHLVGYGADGQHVQVGEIDQLVQGEVLVADVSAADDRHRAVGGHRLVVHAVIQAQRVGHEAHGAGIPRGDRVEQRDADIRVGIEQQECLVIGLPDPEVVQQQAHANAAVRRVQQFLDQQAAGFVRVPDVVLDVERLPGRAGQGDPGGQRLDALAQRVGSALPRMGVRAGVESLGQRGVAGVQFPAFLARVVFGQAGAAGEQQDVQQRQRGGERRA